MRFITVNEYLCRFKTRYLVDCICSIEDHGEWARQAGEEECPRAVIVNHWGRTTQVMDTVDEIEAMIEQAEEKACT